MAITLDGATQHIRKRTAVFIRYYAAQNKYGNNPDLRSRCDMLAAIKTRATLMKKVRPHIEKRWPDARGKYKGYLVDAFAAMYAMQDAHDSRLLQEMRQARG